MNAYEDPSVQVDVERIDYDGKSFTAIRVHECADVPVLARKDSPTKSGKLVTREAIAPRA